jgi:hypothetical protein
MVCVKVAVWLMFVARQKKFFAHRRHAGVVQKRLHFCCPHDAFFCLISEAEIGYHQSAYQACGSMEAWSFADGCCRWLSAAQAATCLRLFLLSVAEKFKADFLRKEK